MATILAATDDSRLYDVLCAEIEGMGHAIEWVVDGRSAWEKTLEIQPDLVLLDLNLPIHDGFETCILLREDPDVPRELPILLLTSEAQDPHKLEKCGVTRVFPKEHLAHELWDVLIKHLGAKAGA